jgi:hypothetical protein
MPPLMLKRWRYAPRGAWPVMHLQSLEKVEVPTRDSDSQGPPLRVEGWRGLSLEFSRSRKLCPRYEGSLNSLHQSLEASTSAR